MISRIPTSSSRPTVDRADGRASPRPARVAESDGDWWMIDGTRGMLARPWGRSRRCRGSRTPWAEPTSIGSRRRWPTPCGGYHRERLGDGVRLITIDLDATDDPTHGQQEFALFNGYYDTWCYLPLVATVTFNTEPIQHVVAALLRPGTGAATRGVRGLLRRLFTKLRALFPRARLRVRADAGFADAKLLAFLDAAEVEYVLGLAGKRRLDKRVRRLLGRARMQARATGETATLYGETRYAARRWDRKRRSS